jgi:hypothetical protein
MSRHKPIAVADLDQLVAAITVDAYGDDEPQIAFVEVFIRTTCRPAGGRRGCRTCSLGSYAAPSVVSGGSG